MEYVRNWCISYQQQAMKGQKLHHCKLIKTIQLLLTNTRGQIKRGYTEVLSRRRSLKQIEDISNTSIYQLMVSPMQHFSARNINCRDSVTNRIVCNVLLQLTLQWNIASYCGHSWWVWQSVPPLLVERVEMSPLQIITWLLNTPDKDRSVGCFCWENLAAASYL